MKEYSGREIYRKIGECTGLKNKKILEIGCGTGRISSYLSKDTHLLAAVDPDENAIKKAQKTIPGVDFSVGSGERLDFSDSSFDLVIFTLSLHHQDSRIAIDEAARVLKPTGKMIIVEPVADGEIERIFSFLHNENHEKAAAQKAITESGLPLVSSEIVTAKWTFENEKDLFQSIFEYYDMDFDPAVALQISSFLGEKIKASPIVCEDKMIIQTLLIGDKNSN